jgi:hypothetical protein
MLWGAIKAGASFMGAFGQPSATWPQASVARWQPHLIVALQTWVQNIGNFGFIL